MLDNELQKIIDAFILQHSIFEVGEIFDDQTDEGFKGITDEYKNYLYVNRDKLVLSEDVSKLYGCGFFEYLITGSLVVAFEACANASIITNVVYRDFASADVKIESYNFDSEAVYLEETGEELKDSNSKYIKFIFNMTVVAKMSICEDLTCIENCCDTGVAKSELESTI